MDARVGPRVRKVTGVTPVARRVARDDASVDACVVGLAGASGRRADNDLNLLARDDALRADPSRASSPPYVRWGR